MADQGFPAYKKLHNSKEFDAVFKRNQYRINTSEFLLLASANNVNQNRLGMVIAKRITPHAVCRNRFKRLIREAFRKTSTVSLDFVVLTRTRANVQSNQALCEILIKSFTSIADQAYEQGNQS